MLPFFKAFFPSTEFLVSFPLPIFRLVLYISFVNQQRTFEEVDKIISELKSQLDDLCEQDIVRISEKGLLKMFMYLICTV